MEDFFKTLLEEQKNEADSNKKEGIWSKFKGAVSDIKSGFDNPSLVVGDALNKISMDKKVTQVGGKIDDTPISQSPTHDEITKVIGPKSMVDKKTKKKKIKSKIKKVVSESFYMKEAEDSETMSTSKDATPGDMVWYVDTETLLNKLKKPEQLEGKIKIDKYHVKFVDMNAPKDNNIKELKEHISSLFYEAAEDLNAPTSTPDSTSEDPKQIEDPKPPIDTKDNKLPPKYIDEKNGTAKVVYTDGPEKGKEVVVKLVDLILDRATITECIQFGYYQADRNVEKATTIYENKIAQICSNLKSGSPLNTKVNADAIQKEKTDVMYTKVMGNTALRKALEEKASSPQFEEAIKEIVDIKAQIEDTKEAKSSGTKMMHIQLVNFDGNTKAKIIDNSINNKPLTKAFVISKGKPQNKFKDVESKLVSKVNYAKGFAWLKAVGASFKVVDGILSGRFVKNILGGLNDYLQQAGDTWSKMGGSTPDIK
jgi:hypothetical protein